MVLKKKKRTAIGKMAMENEYPKITFVQAIDLVTSAKHIDGVHTRMLKNDYKNWDYFIEWNE